MLTLYITKLASLVWVSSIFLVIEVETNMLQIAMLIKLLTVWLLHPHNDAMPVLHFVVMPVLQVLHFVVIAKVDRYSTVFAVLHIFILNT